MIIGLCGPAGCGKGTAAGLLVEHGFVPISFADPLYEMVSAMTGIPVSGLQDRQAKETTIPWLGKSPRQLLQTLGTEWGRKQVGEGVWIAIAMRRAAEWPRVVIPDVRYDNEALAIRARGGKVFRVVRGGVACLTNETAAHASEAGVSPELIDGEIDNSGSIHALRFRIEAALARLHTDIMRKDSFATPRAGA